jgi:serine/threonine protein kinase
MLSATKSTKPKYVNDEDLFQKFAPPNPQTFEPPIKRTIETEDDTYEVSTKAILSGNFGSVVFGRSVKTNELVAIKTSSLLNKPEYIQNLLLDEVVFSKELSHFNIGKVYAALVEEELKQTIIVMKFADRGDLFDLVLRTSNADENFSFLQCLSILIDLCRALNFLHNEQNIIHRDLKLENVLVGPNGNLLLIDFGLATKLPASTENDPCGTPQYSAPESYLQNSLSYKLDYWSLGVILYACVALRILFSDNKNNGALDAIAHGKFLRDKKDISLPEKYSDHPMASYVHSLLRFNPDKRPPLTQVQEQAEEAYVEEAYVELRKRGMQGGKS